MGADCLHQLDLCPDCDGLRVTELNLLPGVSSLQLGDDSGAVVRHAGVRVYVGPPPGRCPNPKAEAPDAC
jgi:hypothetical protein